MTTARERLIDKLADEMDRDNATVFVDEVIVEALEQLREMGDLGVDANIAMMKLAKPHCAVWLHTCLTLGWRRADLDALERLWWQYHDERGRLIECQACEANP